MSSSFSESSAQWLNGAEYVLSIKLITNNYINARQVMGFHETLKRYVTRTKKRDNVIMRAIVQTNPDIVHRYRYIGISVAAVLL